MPYRVCSFCLVPALFFSCLFCFSFRFSCFSSALLFMCCLSTVLFCCLPTLGLWHLLLPLPPSLPSLPPFPPSFLLSFRCLFVGKWSQSSETPSPVRRAPVCGAVDPSAAQQLFATPHASLWGPLGHCVWSGRCASAMASSTVELARWQVVLEEEVEQQGQGLLIWALDPSGS